MNDDSKVILMDHRLEHIENMLENFTQPKKCKLSCIAKGLTLLGVGFLAGAVYEVYKNVKRTCCSGSCCNDDDFLPEEDVHEDVSSQN